MDYVHNSANQVDKLSVVYDFFNSEKLNLLFLYTCNAACAHCITESTPHKKDCLDLKNAEAVLEKGAEYGKKMLSISGGEPFVKYAYLKHIARKAKSLGYTIFVDTNAFWAYSFERACRVIEEIAACGIKGIFPSASPFHLPFVSLERVQNAILACEAMDMTCEVNFYPGTDPDLNDNICSILELEKRGYYCDGLSTRGNDVSFLSDVYLPKKVEELIDTSSFYLSVTPRGDFIGNVDISYECTEFYGTPFFLGNIFDQSLDALFQKEQDNPFIRIVQKTPPAEVAKVLYSSSLCSYFYKFSQKVFASETEFWLEVCKSEYWEDMQQLLRTTDMNPKLKSN